MTIRRLLPSSLRWRLSALIAAMIALSLAFSALVALVVLSRASTDRATADLQRTLTGASRLLSTRESELSFVAGAMAIDPSIAGAIRARNRPALLANLHHYSSYLNGGFVEAIDAQGRVLGVLGTGPSSGNAGVPPDVRAALAGHTSVAFAQAPPRHGAMSMTLRAAAPLVSDLRIVGVIVAGSPFDSAFTRSTGAELNADVNLLTISGQATTTRIIGKGFAALSHAEASALASRIESGRTTIATVHEDGQVALSGLIPLRDATSHPVGALEVLEPLNPFYDAIEHVSWLLLVLGAAVAALGLLLAVRVVRRLTGRLLVLEVAAAQTAAVAGAAPVLDDKPSHGEPPHVTTSPPSSAALDIGVRRDTSSGDIPTGSRSHAIVRGDDELASLARSFDTMRVALDERRDANVRLYAAAQARVRELTGLAEIARLLTATSSLQDTLRELGEHVCRLVGCVATAISLPRVGGAPALHGGHGLPDNYAALIDAGWGSDVVDAALPWQQALRDGTVCWRRLDTLPERYAALRDTAGVFRWGAATALPLRLQDRSVGVMVCYSHAPAPLTPADLSLLITIADQVAVAVENARLHARSRDLAALEERARLARELHDSVTQALFSMTLHARAAQLALQRQGIDPTAPLGRSVAQLGDLAQGALAEMRALIFELRPGALGEEGLVAALRKQAAALQAREGLSVEVEAPAERLALDMVTEEQLYRLAQEALHNVVKHAGARHVRVRVAGDSQIGSLVLEVSDDGVGFDPQVARPGHLGLGTMAERAGQLGGHVEFVSAPGQGTTVRAVVPT